MPLRWLTAFVFTLLTVGLFFNHTLAQSSSWDIWQTAGKNRAVWVDGLKLSEVQTGDTIKLTSPDGEVESREVSLVIYSHNKTGILFSEAVENNYKGGFVTVTTKSRRGTIASADTTNVGRAYGNVKLSAPIPDNSKKLWLKGRLQDALQTGDAITLTADNRTLTLPVRHVIVYQDRTMLLFKERIAEGFPMAWATKGTTPNVLTQPGVFEAELGPAIFSDILVANQTQVPLMSLNFSAREGSLSIPVLSFVNDLDNNPFNLTDEEKAGMERVNLKMYNDNGRLLSTGTMQSGKVRFDINNLVVDNQRPTTVDIRADVKDINDVSQSGKKLRLAFATRDTETIFGQEFLILKTDMTVRHASIQTTFPGTSANEQEFYRFTVTADAAGEVTIEQLVLELNLNGMAFSDKPDYRLLEVKADGNLDTPLIVAESVQGNAQASDNSDTITIDFLNQVVPAGQSRTYALLFNNTISVGGEEAISISIKDDMTAGPAGPAAVSTLKNQHNIVWSDDSDQGGANDFFNGYLLSQDTAAKVLSDRHSGTVVTPPPVGPSTSITTDPIGVTFAHAQTQPSFTDPSQNEQAFYRFSISTDRDIAEFLVRLKANLTGMTFTDVPAFNMLKVKPDGTTDNIQIVMSDTSFVTLNEDKTEAFFRLVSANESIQAGETSTYELRFNNTANAGVFEDDDDAVSVNFDKGAFKKPGEATGAELENKSPQPMVIAD